MGEIADLMIDGEICEGCGEELGGEAPGYPRRCEHCARAYKEFHAEPVAKTVAKGSPMPKVRCPRCNKAVKARGVVDHLVQAHGYDP